MAKYYFPQSKKAGLPPGTFIHVGKKRVEGATISLFSYNSTSLKEASSSNPDEILNQVDPSAISWINVSGLSQTDIIQKIGERFGLHPLIIEDILDTNHRPKIEDHGGYLFTSIKMLYPDEDGGRIIYEQVSFILGEHFVLTFQEGGRDVFDPVRERIRTAKGKTRAMGPDYLVYTLIDAVVDHYYVVLEKLGEHIESTEEQLVINPTNEIMKDIHGLKNELLFLRRTIWPLRDVIGFLERGDTDLIAPGTTIYFRDVYDHTIQVYDTCELYRDIISGMLDTYLSSLSNRLNEVMKVLTVFSTIFIPLTFIVGIYGMNFEFMPELKWHWSYPALWVFMISVVAIMIRYFRKRRWI
jgi:magnesium transporter